MGFRSCLSGSIAAPPRSSPLAAVIVLAVIGALTVAMVVPHRADPWILVALALLLFLAIVVRAVYAIHIALFALAWMLWVGYFPDLQWWPFHLLGPLIVYGAAVTLFPPLRRPVGWLRVGSLGDAVWSMVVATAIISAAALILWTAFAKPNLAGSFAMMPAMPLYVYPLAAIGFAFLNAAMEEVVFRGIMLEALDSALGETSWSLGMQAVSFAALHYRSGFPNGGLGVLMVFVYGLMLGMVRRRAGGLLAPWIAHVAADITIFTTLVVMLTRK
jgi:membrane protease YdiL (CAAX protease family)